MRFEALPPIRSPSAIGSTGCREPERAKKSEHPADGDRGQHGHDRRRAREEPERDARSSERGGSRAARRRAALRRARGCSRRCASSAGRRRARRSRSRAGRSTAAPGRRASAGPRRTGVNALVDDPTRTSNEAGRAGEVPAPSWAPSPSRRLVGACSLTGPPRGACSRCSTSPTGSQ